MLVKKSEMDRPMRGSKKERERGRERERERERERK